MGEIDKIIDEKLILATEEIKTQLENFVSQTIQDSLKQSTIVTSKEIVDEIDKTLDERIAEQVKIHFRILIDMLKGF